jgi:predicted N-acetyltransferase YhbS
MNVELRPEEEKDYRIVENLTREAFWNYHVPGCDEHYLIHNLRKAKEFIRELDFVATNNGKIIGNIVYAKTIVIKNALKHTVLTFGPLSVLPEYRNKGIGGKLINHTVKLSKELGFTGIIIYGDPEYYKRFGFKESKHFKITNKDNKYPASLLVLELFSGSLNGIEGIFDEGEIYQINSECSEAFDKEFPVKEKGYSKTQERFKELLDKYV